jgi:hypothetical protein
MTLHDVRRIFHYAKTHPSLRALVGLCAAALGVKLPELETKSDKPSYMTAGQFAALVQATGGRVPGVGPMGS